tara:strand:- start:69 stop:1016 length:948 start_codon:yes stop_codon:yes gene_type:complete
MLATIFKRRIGRGSQLVTLARNSEQEETPKAPVSVVSRPSEPRRQASSQTKKNMLFVQHNQLTKWEQVQIVNGDETYIPLKQETYTKYVENATQFSYEPLEGNSGRIEVQHKFGPIRSSIFTTTNVMNDDAKTRATLVPVQMDINGVLTSTEQMSATVLNKMNSKGFKMVYADSVSSLARFPRLNNQLNKQANYLHASNFQHQSLQWVSNGEQITQDGLIQRFEESTGDVALSIHSNTTAYNIIVKIAGQVFTTTANRIIKPHSTTPRQRHPIPGIMYLEEDNEPNKLIKESNNKTYISRFLKQAKKGIGFVTFS